MKTKPYRIEHAMYLVRIGRRRIVIDNGFQVVKDRLWPSFYLGIKLQCDPFEIATFDDEKTARAVCRDLNRSATA